MKRFSGILLCSDYDGTLAWGGVPEANLKAIRRFMEAGGMFTLATGRGGESLSQPDALPVRPNVPVACLCGAQLYDLQAGRTVRADFLPEKWSTAVSALLRSLKCVKRVEIVCEGGLRSFEIGDQVAAREAMTTESGVYKIVLFGDGIAAFVPFAAERLYGVCCASANGADSIELTCFGTDKGSAALRLKALTGAHTLVCVGDYQGDVSMLKAADVGFAVENAIPEAKAAADFVTAHARDGAIAAVIEAIEEKLNAEAGRI